MHNSQNIPETVTLNLATEARNRSLKKGLLGASHRKRTFAKPIGMTNQIIHRKCISVVALFHLVICNNSIKTVIGKKTKI